MNNRTQSIGNNNVIKSVALSAVVILFVGSIVYSLQSVSALSPYYVGGAPSSDEFAPNSTSAPSSDEFAPNSTSAPSSDEFAPGSTSAPSSDEFAPNSTLGTIGPEGK